MKVSLLLFDGYTALDAVGAYEVLARIPGFDFECVGARHKGVIAADTRRLGLAAWRTLDELDATDVLLIPGGPGALALEEDHAFLDKLRALDATTTWTVAICNGVGLLGAAGLLKGRCATTNFFYRERLRGYGAKVVDERYCDDGKYVTGAGVSASIDTALWFAGKVGGPALMKALGLGIEYFPSPPYPERRPEDSPAEIQALVRAAEEAQLETLRVEPPFPTRG